MMAPSVVTFSPEKSVSPANAAWEEVTPELVDQFAITNDIDPSELEATAKILIDDGAVVVDLSERTGPAETLTQILDFIGKPIRVFGNFPFWRPIGVRLDKEPSRSEGIGNGPFHMDFVNASEPPRYVCLYCVRPDPAGGGASVISSIEDAINQLESAERERLEDPAFNDGQVVGLENIGVDINPFAVITKDSDWPFRYTGSLLSASPTPAGYPMRALERLESFLRNGQSEFKIDRGQALIFNNRRFVHARQSLGPGQEDIPQFDRRLLQQGFASIVRT